jgi:Asp-tRNA(Asn)/Glu-tRNA(Gln) amidotransferase A subunit family amidase
MTEAPALLDPLPLAPLAERLHNASAEDLQRLVAGLLDRADTNEPRLRVLAFEEGRAARLRGAVEALVAQYPDPASRPLLFGVPVGVKDIIAVDGLPTRAGSAVPPEAFEMQEATAVRRLVDAGALVFGKTVTAEFASMGPGPTANPHDPARTPGGSSSGSAAGVAAGYFPLALGTQTGGSVIRPAAFCGIVGFKPSYDRLPADGVLPHAASVDTVGTFTTDVAGAILAARVLVDGWHDAPPPDPAGVVLGVPEGAYLALASEEGRAGFEAALSRLAEAGVTVQRVPFLDDIDDVLQRHRWLQEAEFAAEHEERFARWAPYYSGNAAGQIDRGRRVSAEQLRAGRDGRLELRERVNAHLDAEGIDALVCPAAVGPAPLGLNTTGDPKMNVPWTHAGVPAVTIPCGDVDDLPLGLQLVGRFEADEALLAAAQALEPLV